MAACVSYLMAWFQVLILNTNKTKGVLNFLGLSKGSLEESEMSWGDQKDWLQEHLQSSSAAWKVPAWHQSFQTLEIHLQVVVGHHPIELIPHSFVEHGVASPSP